VNPWRVEIEVEFILFLNFRLRQNDIGFLVRYLHNIDTLHGIIKQCQTRIHVINYIGTYVCGCSTDLHVHTNTRMRVSVLYSYLMYHYAGRYQPLFRVSPRHETYRRILLPYTLYNMPTIIPT